MDAADVPGVHRPARAREGGVKTGLPAVKDLLGIDPAAPGSSALEG